MLLRPVPQPLSVYQPTGRKRRADDTHRAGFAEKTLCFQGSTALPADESDNPWKRRGESWKP